MGNVISMADHKPHVGGDALCTACNHRWVAAAEAGSTTLECPKCNRTFGLLRHPIEPDTKWQCNCGEMLFWLTQGGAMCRGCGVISTDWCNA